MARYHVNPHTGNPGQCHAKVSCPYGNLETDHFDSAEAAREAYEAGNLDKAFVTLTKTVDEVLEEATDEDLLASLERSGYPTFDPDLGPEQLTVITAHSPVEEADGWPGEEEKPPFLPVVPERGESIVVFGEPGTGKTAPVEDYHPLGSDEPALTDEAMQEMDQHLTAVRDFDWWAEQDEEDEDTYVVRVGGYGEIQVDDYRLVEAAERLNGAGQWSEFEGWDEKPEVKLRTVARYLAKPEALYYISDAKLDNEDKLAQLGEATDLSTESKRFRLRLDTALLTIAGNTLMDEEGKRRGVDLFNPGGTPPF